MRSLIRTAIILALMFSIQLLIQSASLAQDSKETATVTGRVSLDGKPAQGVIVMATPSVSDPTKMMEQMLKPANPLKTTTDSDGRYSLEAVPAGKYYITPSTPALINADPGALGKELNVAGAAAIEGIDFSLSRGGVITGKLTDSEGHPLIAEEISLKSADAAKTETAAYSRSVGRMYFTDDRGIYRIFALPPGRYIVSAGSARDPIANMITKRPRRVQTFYPGVTDEAKARLVEVIAGAEASAIDIKLAMADKGFSVNGRVLAMETGAPIANAMIAYHTRAGEISPNRSTREEPGVPGGMTITNAKGEFRLDSITPGNYSLEVQSLGGLSDSSTFYADPVKFEVQSANVDKLEIKVHLGAGISGVAVIEGAQGGNSLETMTQLVLVAVGTKSSSPGMGKVAADGTFRIGGLRAGKANIRTVSYGTQQFSVLRVERDGMDQSDGIDIQANEQISGVRVVVVAANCVIRGHVTIQGTLVPDSEITVWARQLSNNNNDSRRSNSVDAKRNFLIEELAPGDYEVEVSAYALGSGAQRRLSAKQTVTVTAGVAAEVNLTLNLQVPDK